AVGRAHREAVVLRGDVDAPARQVLDRVVGAAMAEGELERLQPERPGEQLVAEADPDHRALPEQLAYGRDDVVERGRVAGPVGEEDQVRIALEHVGGRARAGQQREPGATGVQPLHDRALDTGVDHYDVRPGA